MNNNTIDFMFTLIESVLLYWLIDSIMPGRFPGKMKLIVVTLVVLINTITIFYLPDFSATFKSLIFFVISLILIHIVYYGKIYIKAFFILVVNYIFLISDILVGNFSSYIANINIQRMLNISIASFEFSVLAKFLNVILIFVFFYFRKINLKCPKNIGSQWMLS